MRKISEEIMADIEKRNGWFSVELWYYLSLKVITRVLHLLMELLELL
jgi:hypothetical protein